MYSDFFSLDERVRTAQINLGNEITNHSARVKVMASARQRLSFKNNDDQLIYYLISGEVELCNINNNLIIANVNHSAVLGLSTIFSTGECCYIKAVSDIELSCMKLCDLIAMVEEKHLWKDVSAVLTWYLSIYYARDELASKTSSYGIVKTYLEMLWEQHQESLSEISIFDFILNRATVSRSSLNKILKELSDGGYIKINRGRLVCLRKLPPGY